MKPIVYLAGPISKPDPLENAHAAFLVATRLVESGLITPIVPQTTIVWHLVTPRPWQFWMDMDRELVQRCDALLRLPGESKGADLEVGWALGWNIPVFHWEQDLLTWAHAWCVTHKPVQEEQIL